MDAARAPLFEHLADRVGLSGVIFDEQNYFDQSFVHLACLGSIRARRISEFWSLPGSAFAPNERGAARFKKDFIAVSPLAFRGGA
jgi:hypothetical protein